MTASFLPQRRGGVENFYSKPPRLCGKNARSRAVRYSSFIIQQSSVNTIFTQAATDAHLLGILRLQQLNLPKNISRDEALEQGFVTVEHDFDILKAMNDAEPHVIALDETGEVVGYALVMLADFGAKIPVLVPMFELLNGLEIDEKRLGETRFFAMGQVCVDKNRRGQGIFGGLYAEMGRRFHGKYDWVVTEIAVRNTRSMRAHEKVGFKTIHFYEDQTDHWAVVVWDFC